MNTQSRSIACLRVARRFTAPALALFAMVTALACSSSEPQGRAPSESAAPSAARTVVDALAGFSPIAPHLGSGNRLEASDSGWRLAGQSGEAGDRTGTGSASVAASPSRGLWTSGGGTLGATLPGTARAPLRLRVEEEPDLWVELVAEGARDVGAEVVDGAVVLRGALEDTDIVHVAEPGRVEELRLLGSTRAASTIRWTLRAGPDVGEVRAENGAFAIADRDGRVRIASGPVFAVDSRGERRDAVVRAEQVDGGWALAASFDLSGLAYPVAVDPAWSTAGSMLVGHKQHRAVRLKDGRVLEVGGITKADGVSATAEIYNPSTDSWSAAKSMLVARVSHTATLLLTGDVLVTSPSAPPYAEVWDAATGDWTPTAPFTPTGYGPGPIAALLPSGKVLVQQLEYGGNKNYALYNPGTNDWAPAAPAATARQGAAVMVLKSGKVLVVGGSQLDVSAAAWISLSSAELYDPVLDQWSDAGAMSALRTNWTDEPFGGIGIVLLPSGKVLVAGGQSDNNNIATKQASADIYDPTANTWTPAASMHEVRGFSGFYLTLLASGKVLASGGEPSVTAEIYNPATNLWTYTDSMKFDHRRGTATGLANGKVLVCGGDGGDPYPYCELFYPLPVGSACNSANRECESGHCVDGYCCDTACSGQCQACNVPSSEGTCSPVSGVPVGGRPACSGAGTSCEGFCDGSSTSCTYPDATTACRAASCSNRTATLAATCDGSGTCPLVTQSCGLYICKGSACGTSCASGADCASTAYCAGTTCALKKTVGQACTAAAQCASGSCADGYCCTTACSGQCEACDIAGKLGICSGFIGGPHGSRQACTTDGSTCGGSCDGISRTACTYPSGTSCGSASCTSGTATLTSTCDGAGKCPPNQVSCAPYLCQGTSCATTCFFNSDCASSAYCSAGACIPKSADGTACTIASACASGFCADGVCCENACGGQCEACNLAGLAGQCLPTPSGNAPRGTRSPCDTDGSVCGGKCDGIQRTACGYPGASTECRASSCTSDIATLKASCDGAGRCPTAETVPCAPYHCGATQCDQCSATSPCTSGYYCSVGVCFAKKTIGATCAIADECTSGYCVDGVCCDAACDGQCEACGMTGSVGTCSVVSGAPYGNRTPCSGTGATCAGSCNGVGRAACAYPTSQCRAPSCTGAEATLAADCDGVGGCPPPQTMPCAPFACGPTQCAGNCTTDANCQAGNYCSAGVCTARAPLGAVCSAASACASGSCVDGVCCDGACTGQCEACNITGSLGTCSIVSGVRFL